MKRRLRRWKLDRSPARYWITRADFRRIGKEKGGAGHPAPPFVRVVPFHPRPAGRSRRWTPSGTRMSSSLGAAVSAALLGSCTIAVQAQSANASGGVGSPPGASASGPARAASAVPAVYRSAFEGYRALTEEPVKSWREANDLVGRIGGWRAYAREVQAGESASGAPAAPSSDPAAPAPAPAASPAGPTAAPANAQPSALSPRSAVPAASPSSQAAPRSHSGHKTP